jgi:hypothetical protein
MLALVPLVLAWGATYEPTPTQLGYGLNGSAGDLFGVAVAATGTLLAVGSSRSHADAGSGRVYAWNGTDWHARGAEVVGGAGERLGSAVALSGDTLVLGSSTAGLVRVYTWNGTGWNARVPDLVGTGQFGYSVSASGGSIAVGAQQAGTVHVFYDNGTQRGPALTGTANDQTGFSVSLSGGDTLAVSSRNGNEDQSGRVRVYDWNGTDWAARGEPIDGTDANDNSGASVSLSGTDMLAIGAPSHLNHGDDLEHGQVRVFVWNGTDWAQRGSTLIGATPLAKLGSSVALSGSVLAASAPSENEGIGQVVVYDLVAGDWRQRGPALNGTAGSYFGIGIALSGGRLAIGAPLQDENAGQVQVYNYAAVDHGDAGLGRDAIVGIAIGGTAVAVAGVALAVHWGC